MNELEERLFSLCDPAYREFQGRLIPSLAPGRMIGVRTPVLRALAKEMAGTPLARDFLSSLPHRYFDEDNLHAFLIAGIRSYGDLIPALDRFLPYVDNWATCDQLRPVAFRRHLPELAEKIPEWLASPHIYTARFGIGMLMTHFLDDAFAPAYPAAVAAVTGEDYYLRMMVAWYFATALAKQYEQVLPYLTEHRLDERTARMTIRKALESYRIPEERKSVLRRLL